MSESPIFDSTAEISANYLSSIFNSVSCVLPQLPYPKKNLRFLKISAYQLLPNQCRMSSNSCQVEFSSQLGFTAVGSWKTVEFFGEAQAIGQ